MIMVSLPERIVLSPADRIVLGANRCPMVDSVAEPVAEGIKTAQTHEVLGNLGECSVPRHRPEFATVDQRVGNALLRQPLRVVNPDGLAVDPDAVLLKAR